MTLPRQKKQNHRLAKNHPLESVKSPSSSFSRSHYVRDPGWLKYNWDETYFSFGWPADCHVQRDNSHNFYQLMRLRLRIDTARRRLSLWSLHSLGLWSTLYSVFMCHDRGRKNTFVIACHATRPSVQYGLQQQLNTPSLPADQYSECYR